MREKRERFRGKMRIIRGKMGINREKTGDKRGLIGALFASPGKLGYLVSAAYPDVSLWKTGEVGTEAGRREQKNNDEGNREQKDKDKGPRDQGLMDFFVDSLIVRRWGVIMRNEGWEKVNGRESKQVEEWGVKIRYAN
jgi:hypothetical protein